MPDSPVTGGDLVEINELRGGHSGKITATEEEWNRRFEVIYTKGTGDITGCASNGIERAAHDLLDHLGWTATSTPTYPGRSYTPPGSDAPESGDSDYIAILDITWVSNTALFAYDITGSQEGDEPVYIFDVKYKAMPFDISTGETATLPWLQPCQISWSSRAYSKVVDCDVFGYPITNSAGDVFDPPIEGQEFHPVVTIVRNELCSYNPNLIPVTIDGFMNTVNSGTVTIAGMTISQGYAKVTNIGATRKDWHGWPYYECTYEIELNPNSWATHPLDQGFNYLVDVNGTMKKQKFNVAEEHDDVPHLLDGTGQPLDADSGGYTEPAVYGTFYTLVETNFALLNLPVNMNDSGVILN